MTTPTTDADRVATLMHEVLTIAMHWRSDVYDGHEALAKVRALLSEGEPAKVRDERAAPPGFVFCDGRSKGLPVVPDSHLYRPKGARSLAEAWRIYDDEHGYAPQGAPPLPDGWAVDRVTDVVGSFWRAFRERDAATIEWADDGSITQDVNVGEDSRGDEVLAVMQHLAARRAK